MAFSREERKINNAKQEKISIADRPPAVNSMAEGEIVMAKLPNKQLGMFVKYKGILWRTYLSPDGNEVVDKSLTVKDSVKSKKAIMSSVVVVNSNAPTAHKDNQIYILSKDASTSNESTLHLFLEEDVIGSASALFKTEDATHKLKIWINGTEYYLGLRTV